MSAAEKLAPPPPPQPVKCRVPHRGDAIAVRTLTLDASKPTVVPGALGVTLRSGVKAGRVKYTILFVPGLRAFQVECIHPNDKVEVVFVPEHLAVQWEPEVLS